MIRELKMQLSVVWDATPCCQKDTNILKSRGNIFLGKICRLRLKCDGTRAETRLRLSTKRTSPFKWAGGSVQSTTGRQAVHIILQGLYCSCKPVFCSHATLTSYPLHYLVSPSLLHSVRHRVPSHFNWTLSMYSSCYFTVQSRNV